MKRGHYRSDGVSKQRHSEEVAIAIASRLQEGDGYPRNAYECGCCKTWHIGHQPSQMKERGILFDELGARAFYCMATENTTRFDTRIKHINRLVEAARIHASKGI